jgi:hypothetical protein
VVYRLHVQCAFRVVRGEQILVGSSNMSYPEDRKADPDAAYDMNAWRLFVMGSGVHHVYPDSPE